MNVTQFVCVFVNLGIQHALHVCHIAMWPSPLYITFSTLSHKRHDLPQRVNEHKMCILRFSETFTRKMFCFKKNSKRYYQKRALVFI